MKEVNGTKGSLFDSSPCRLAVLSYQCVKGGDGEHPQAPQGGFGRAAGDGQQALWVGQLAALQAGQVAAHPEQVHVEPLQVLLPLLDLKETNSTIICRFGVLISNCRAVWFLGERESMQEGSGHKRRKKYDPEGYSHFSESKLRVSI